MASLINALTSNFNRVEPQAAVTYDAVGSAQGAPPGPQPAWPGSPPAGSSQGELFSLHERCLKRCQEGAAPPHRRTGRRQPATPSLPRSLDTTKKILETLGRGPARDVCRAGLHHTSRAVGMDLVLHSVDVLPGCGTWLTHSAVPRHARSSRSDMAAGSALKQCQPGELPEQCVARAGVQSFTVHAYDFAVSDVPLTPPQYAAITRRALTARLASSCSCACTPKLLGNSICVVQPALCVPACTGLLITCALLRQPLAEAAVMCSLACQLPYKPRRDKGIAADGPRLENFSYFPHTVLTLTQAIPAVPVCGERRWSDHVLAR